MRNLGLLVSVLLLTGCVGGGTNVVTVEDRTGKGPSRVTDVPSGTVLEAPASADVKVAPVTDLPVRQERKAGAPVSGGWVNTQEVERSHTPNPAVVALLGSAEHQITKGSYRAAASTLERAQRIAPREPEVYYQMAQLRMRSGEWTQAEQLALKGIQLAPRSIAMQRKLWLLIADIREDAGDRTGSQRARIKARRL